MYLIVYDCYITLLWSEKLPEFLTVSWMSKISMVNA